MSNFKILGQEPAFYVGVVEAALAVALSFGIFGLDQQKVGVIVAAVSAVLGFVTAYATKTTALSALVGAAKALLVLAVTFGAPLTDSQTAAAIAFITIFAGAWLRERTASLETAVSSASPGAQVVAVPAWSTFTATPVA
jgi:hypothetical protein